MPIPTRRAIRTRPSSSATRWVQFGNALLYRRVARNPVAVSRYARDLPGDRWDTVLFDHALLGLGLGIGLLIAVFGWEIGLIAAVTHASVYLLGGGAINGIGHKWGKRPHDNLATNNQWLAWLVAGEGLHNNHHAATTSGRLSMAKGEFDPGWWAIRTLVLLRWATVRHDTVACPHHPGPDHRSGSRPGPTVDAVSRTGRRAGRAPRSW